MNPIQCWAYGACIWSAEHYIERKVVDDTENQRSNVGELFTSENAEISVVVDLKGSVEVPVETVEPVVFQIRNPIEPLLSKQNCWTQQLHKAYIKAY